MFIVKTLKSAASRNTKRLTKILPSQDYPAAVFLRVQPVTKLLVQKYLN